MLFRSETVFTTAAASSYAVIEDDQETETIEWLGNQGKSTYGTDLLFDNTSTSRYLDNSKSIAHAGELITFKLELNDRLIAEKFEEQISNANSNSDGQGDVAMMSWEMQPFVTWY